MNGQLTGWFDISSGVRQGDSLSPTLFAIFINDMADEMRRAQVGVPIGGEYIDLLMYADDVVLISPSADKAQKQLDVMAEWCNKWGMSINQKKSQVVHIRNHQKQRCNTVLNCGGKKLDYVPDYKYLGYTINEFLSPNKTVEALTAGASRSFGRIVNIFRKLKNMGIRSYETLFNTYVVPIMNYASGVWGYADQNAPQVLQNRIQRYYLGVHKFTSVVATQLEFDWANVRSLRWVEIARYFNRLQNMNDDRIPVLVHKWDRSLKTQAWFSDLKHILAYSNIECDYDGETVDLDVLSSRLLYLNRQRWWQTACTQPKLCTFIEIFDREQNKALVKANLNRRHRSLLAKLKCGVLPLAIDHWSL